MDEFALIRRYFDRVCDRQDVRLGVGDDAALVLLPPGCELAISTDTMVEAVHFPTGAPAHAIGYRALATNLSDLAAMGAEPAWATLALTLPASDAAWLEAFSAGFFELADEFDVALIGGDVTRGPLTVTVTVHGAVPAGAALRRSGAAPGERIFVTGELGAAAVGLAAYPDGPSRGRYLYPRPRIAEGGALRRRASAAIDVSDGLLADLGHILDASGVGATVTLDAIPFAAELERFDADAARRMALTGGDDYELCFTVEPARVDELLQSWSNDHAPLREIGVVEARPGLRCRTSDGRAWTPPEAGYRHFGEQ